MCVYIYIWICFYLELSEDKSLAIGQNADDGAAIAAEDDQTTFDVKYLGNTPVDSAAAAVAEAVKTILVMVSSSLFFIILIIGTIYVFRGIPLCTLTQLQTVEQT